MPLDPQAEALLAPLNAAPTVRFSDMGVAAVRAMYEQMSIAPAESVAAVARVEDRGVPGPAGVIPVRVYTPEAAEPMPTLVFFHGGGFVIGGLDTHDSTCRDLANGARCCVVSVDYRLAPEHRYPAAPDDCYAATRYVAEHCGEFGGDVSRLAVAGDSAGGNLATGVCLQARDREGPELAHQLLIYPVTNHAFDTDSYRENAEGYLLTTDAMQWFWEQYLEDPAQGGDPLASPLRSEDLSGLPPATVITAQYDPLRDEGEAYAEALIAGGTRTKLVRYDGMFHGFFSMPASLDQGRKAVAQACADLRQAFAA